MARAFAATMIRLEPRTWFLIAILLSIGAALLAVGDWHFVGDVGAGFLVGATAGVFVAELWLAHARRHEPTA